MYALLESNNFQPPMVKRSLDHNRWLPVSEDIPFGTNLKRLKETLQSWKIITTILYNEAAFGTLLSLANANMILI